MVPRTDVSATARAFLSGPAPCVHRVDTLQG